MNLTKAKETKTRVCCLYRVSTKGQVDKAENDILCPSRFRGQ